MNKRKYKNCERLFQSGWKKEDLEQKIKTFSARRKEYWIERGYPENEAITIAKSKMPGSFEYFTITKKLSPEDAKTKVIEFQNNRKNTLENFIKKHGEEAGKIKFQSYCDKQAYSNTLEYMIQKYGENLGTEKYYSANKRRAITLDNLVKKHGNDIGEKIYSEYVSKQRINGKTIEYFISKYGNEKGRQIYEEIGRRKSQSYEGFLIRHDGNIEIATLEFEKYCKNRYESNLFKRGVSKSSQYFFKKLHAELLKLNIGEVYYADFNQEWGINIIGKRFVYLDFFLKSKGKVIEYYGDYYHANPSMFDKTSVIKRFGGIKTAEEIWGDDNRRLDDIKSVPYVKDVLVVWASEIEENEQEIIQKCVNYLLT